MAAQTTCAHDGCDCGVESPNAFMKDGKTYCSSSCASGQGCSHPGCNCSRGANS
ncbi:MAG TPA: metallothionein [Gammaproteobacteria bacterium]|nr:metallothionein [Gammaproteobacteria bacterium]